MRRFTALLLAAICISALVAPAFAETKTVTGEVISLPCYFENKNLAGKLRLLCALATVKHEGNPVGLLTADGAVYQFGGGLVANNNAKAVPLLSHTVTVTGDVFEKAGMKMLSADDAKMVK